MKYFEIASSFLLKVSGCKPEKIIFLGFLLFPVYIRTGIPKPLFMKWMFGIFMVFFSIFACAQQGREKYSSFDYMWMNIGNEGFSAGHAIYTSLAFSPADGQPCVAFCDDSLSGKAALMKFNGIDWVYVGTRGFSAMGAAYTSLAFSPTDSLPYVAYQDAVNYYEFASVMKYNGTAWVYAGSEGFSPSIAEYTSLAFSSYGQPFVAFRDFENGVSVMRLSGNVWAQVGNRQFSAGDAEYISLAINPADKQPWVVYEDKADSGKATVMRFNGAGWVNAGPAGFTADSVWFTSIAFNPSDGLAYVAYADFSSPYKAEVMKFDSTHWVSVGDSGASGGPVKWVSLAFDPEGHPCVSYSDLEDPGNRATVRKYDGNNWIGIGNVDFSAGQVLYTSLAFRPSNGQAYLAYQDWGNSGKLTVMYFNGSVGTGDIQPTRPIIYPNPSSGKITIKTSNSGRFSILNFNSQELISGPVTGPATQIDISGLSPGVYVVRVTGENSVMAEKVIKP